MGCEDCSLVAKSELGTKPLSTSGPGQDMGREKYMSCT